jgi:epoxyqueuosine reductase
MAITKSEIDEILKIEEIDKVGIVSLDDWKDKPIHGKLEELLPEAKSVIVLAMELLSETVKCLTPHRMMGERVMHDLYNRNTELINGHLDWEAYKIVKRLHRFGYKGLSLTASGAPYDTRFIEPLFSYKEAARLAGMGTIGWHSMLLTSEFGARVRLACVVSNAPLLPTTIVEQYDPCPECGGACIKICPIGAIKQPVGEESTNVDKYACSNYLNTAGGCSQCMKVCPAGQ